MRKLWGGGFHTEALYVDSVDHLETHSSHILAGEDSGGCFYFNAFVPK